MIIPAKDRIRLFIALKIPDRLKKELGKLERHLQEQHHQEVVQERSTMDRAFGKKIDALRFAQPDQLHITLAFLGSISQEHIAMIEGIVRDIASAIRPFALFPTTLGAFPRLARPSLVWVGLGGDTEILASLAHELEERLARAHILPIRGSGGFAPHITIAHVLRKNRRHNLRSIAELLTHTEIHLEDFSIPVTEIILYQSNLHHQGPQYVPLVAVKLGK